MKYYKDTQGNIYAVSPIQTPKKEWVMLSKKETEEHLNPTPTTEQLAKRGRAERDSALRVLDAFVSNPLRYAELTEAQKTKAKTYRQALLDVPQQKGFPTTYEMPEAPSWLS